MIHVLLHRSVLLLGECKVPPVNSYFLVEIGLFNLG